MSQTNLQIHPQGQIQVILINTRIPSRQRRHDAELARAASQVPEPGFATCSSADFCAVVGWLYRRPDEQLTNGDFSVITPMSTRFCIENLKPRGSARFALSSHKCVLASLLHLPLKTQQSLNTLAYGEHRANTEGHFSVRS